MSARRIAARAGMLATTITLGEVIGQIRLARGAEVRVLHTCGLLAVNTGEFGYEIQVGWSACWLGHLSPQAKRFA